MSNKTGVIPSNNMESVVGPIDLTEIHSDVHFLRIVSNDGILATKKIVVEK